MRVALIQMSSGHNKEKNIECAVRLIEKSIAQHKAELIILPETFNYRGELHSSNKSKKYTEFIPGESLLPLMSIAEKSSVYILAGSVYERVRANNKCFNTSVLIDSNGEIILKYRKINLFKASIGSSVADESDYYLQGDEIKIAKVKNFQIGFTICFDLRFPELFRKYFTNDIEAICVPSSFTRFTGKAHWEVLLRARAIENNCYILAPNQIGYDSNNIESFGNSMIINPWGEVCARASENKEEIICFNLSKDSFLKTKKILPYLFSKN